MEIIVYFRGKNQRTPMQASGYETLRTNQNTEQFELYFSDYHEMIESRVILWL